MFFGATVFAAPVLAQTPEPAAEVQLGEITITGAFIRATMPRAPVGAAYVTMTNTGAQDDRLLSVTAPFGETVMLHDMVNHDGIIAMHPLPRGLPIPAGESVSLTPGGKHMMITGLTERLEKGQAVDLTLMFELAGEVTLRFDVLALNARRHPGVGNAGEN
ncbi:copper chaperone PCu(A)C (plasmid) [Pseudorhodobacter turbinis]|uniref:Copper chaperone PCu(A)C n=2 Tax=Pseudorhodobacter turbinis TaxID=2500533 RepID=A0A4P8EL92_9RHOB|nr:copper chaperone PCu(A)C [Pseudorhodobacter turbinis]